MCCVVGEEAIGCTMWCDTFCAQWGVTHNVVSWIWSVDWGLETATPQVEFMVGAF